MSKLIVEMEMPTVCDECPMMYDGIVCAATGTAVYPNHKARILKNGREFDPCENRLDDCPICGELPDEHGDLIDRDVASEAFTRAFDEWDRDVAVFSPNGVVGVLKSQQAVIAAERKKDE
jgi:hypothetical protein